MDGVYIDGANGAATRFRWVKAPMSEEPTHLAQRIGRFLERQGLLERDPANGYLAVPAEDGGPRDQLRGHSITYRIAVDPQAGRKVFSLQTLPTGDPVLAMAMGSDSIDLLPFGVMLNRIEINRV
jgi:hypothetical protein